MIFQAFSFTADIHALEASVMHAWGELDDYVDDMVAQRRHSLSDDLISDLIRAEDDGDRIDATELQMLAGGLLLAGTDTTRNQVAASVQVLCEHPDQWELLRDNPELAMPAVEETMRHSPIAGGVLRVVADDVELDGYIFPAGTMVLVNTFAANRDPTVYDDPDRVDITREGAPRDLDLRRRGALLPGRQSGEARDRRGAERSDWPAAQPADHRAGALEADRESERAEESAHRIRLV